SHGAGLYPSAKGCAGATQPTRAEHRWHACTITWPEDVSRPERSSDTHALERNAESKRRRVEEARAGHPWRSGFDHRDVKSERPDEGDRFERVTLRQRNAPPEDWRPEWAQERKSERMS